MTWAWPVLLVLGLALADPVSRRLAAAEWPHRDPVGALLLWQAVGLAGGLALLGAGVTAALAPLGDGLWDAAHAVLDGRLGELDAWRWVVLAVTVLVAARLLGVLAVVGLRTLRARRKHRDLLDVLATPWPAAPGALVLDYPVPVAYCLPGPRSRVVVSRGALTTLAETELSAVLAHEHAHLRERHDLVVLPFVAWGATVHGVPGLTAAQRAVATLIEMRADDVAAAEVGDEALARALRAVGSGAEDAAHTAFTAATEQRLARVRHRPQPLPFLARVAVRLVAVLLIAVPTALLL
ncbi:M56 family metallopeptidase [Thermocrispum municipale]|jgi:Zn-dependent protease with chaperone function|uniref:M56 family metallopeptidase n=1 Tax=Thermocrispum municipale TaxID=37926 RepID=UPI00042A055F|nr:M56 family metallopeptidase [Thermocrispum municipale]